MVMFGLNRQEIQDGYDSASMQPYDAARDSAPGFFKGSGSALIGGLEQSAAQAVLFAGDAAQPYVEAATKPIDEYLKTDLTDDYNQWRTHNLDTVIGLQPDPQVTGLLGNVLYGAASVVPQYTIGALGTKNPAGGAALVGTLQGYAKKRTLEREGIDSATANEAGLIEGIAQGAGALIPAAMPGSLVRRLTTGAAINTTFGAVQRGATSAILSSNGYKDMAEQYKVLDGSAMITDAVLGATFGGLFGEKAKSKVDPLQSDIDLALAGNNVHKLEIEAAPGIPADVATRNAHIDSMNTATEQLLRGDVVDVAGKLDNSNFVAKPEEMDVGLKEAIDEYMTEHQIVYHGTPHEFDDFSMEKIGTGEGAQSYGHGLYFTNNRKIAEGYAEPEGDLVLKNKTLNIGDKRFDENSIRLAYQFRGIDEAIAGMNEKIETEKTNIAAGYDQQSRKNGLAQMEEAVSGLQKLKKAGAEYKTKTGNVYQTKIPSSGKLLDWTLPFTEQPAKVKKALLNSGKKIDTAAASGSAVYWDLVKQLGGARQASEFLKSIGIPGHKYFADMQRGARGEQGYNYVIYDEAAAQKVKPEKLKAPESTAPKAGAEAKEQAPEISAAQSIATEKPDLQIVHEDGSVSTAAEALAKADEEIKQAQETGKLFETAVNCFLRNGE